LTAFYRPQVIYALRRLQAMGAHLPDPAYQVEGSFYVMAKLQALIGTPMSIKAKSAFTDPHEVIQTDEDLVYSLLFDDKIMLAPGSYFGLDPTMGYVRITCSMGERDLGRIFDVIEGRLSH
ncbi:MAG TPA: pyridoxal phosphate-dependent aminotransferase, partial [Gammaproteobacteria bacterium]|nr:pyridoxal phosphate-dependent aminotransferase [Gammaproteobacteria bacterium]